MDAVSWMTPLQPSERPDHLSRPVGHDLLELGEGGARLPRQPQDPEAGAQVVAEHGGQLAVGREVAEEAGVLPVGEAGKQVGVEIAQDGLEGLGGFREGSREAPP